MLVRRLLALLPHLIEGVWRKLKDLLLPRRCYNSVAELQAALLIGLKVLGAS